MEATMESLRESAPAAAHPERSALVIFGATGDLNKRKLIPALYHLHLNRRLPEGLLIVGSARSVLNDDDFRRQMRDAVERFSRGGIGNDNEWARFADLLHYVPANYREPDSYLRLKDRLHKLEREHGTEGKRVLYLAIPPDQYAPVARQIAVAGLAGRHQETGGWTRLVVEKPFGIDLETARQLNRELHEFFNESQIYRIDHYLGKETVQNILVFRFGNAVFEPIWNRRYVDYVQITAAETVGVEARGAYYEQAGTLRDMFQNHLLQLVCMTAMEPPAFFAADAVHDEKAKVLHAIRPIAPDDAVRGQYGPGEIGAKPLPGYRQEEGVDHASTTETYSALKLWVDNWRWQGVPFYLRSGKRLAKRVTEIAIHFKKPPLTFFQSCAAIDGLGSNVLVMRIQPDEGVSLTFEVKPPGPEVCVNSLSLDFDYEVAFGAAPPDAYETLLLDALRGDSTLFTRQDWVELAWALLDPLLGAWHKTRADFIPIYPAGSWGPKEADAFIEKDGHHWRKL